MLNEALRLVRIYHDKNQTEMAKLLSISNAYLSEIENGKKRVTISLLERYSSALDISMSSLLYFAEELEGVTHPSRTRVVIANKVLGFLKLLAADRIIDEQESDRTKSN